jgi:hypothetical protein
VTTAHLNRHRLPLPAAGKDAGAGRPDGKWGSTPVPFTTGWFTDFGLSATGTLETEQLGEPDTTLIVPGSGAMTPAYCSPEQANGFPVTRRTDLWSWALSVLEMFQGERTWPVE